MTDQEFAPRRLDISPAQEGAAERTARQREIGLASVPDERFDAIARKIVQETGALGAMVNFVGGRRMYFAGTAARADIDPGEPAFLADPGREMALDQGYCPHVVKRERALVLKDVCDYPRFVGNPVIDEIGVRSYLGAPLIYDGTVVGTVCAVDPTPHNGPEDAEWGQRGLETIKRMAREAVDEIRLRDQASTLIQAAAGPALVTIGRQLQVLYANAAHEKLFGAVPELGMPAAQVFPGLGTAGVTAAVQQVLHTGTPAVTAPVLLADERRMLFAIVPAQVPGHASVQLTLGVIDAEADHAIALARELSDNLTKLCQ